MSTVHNHIPIIAADCTDDELNIMLSGFLSSFDALLCAICPVEDHQSVVMLSRELLLRLQRLIHSFDRSDLSPSIVESSLSLDQSKLELVVKLVDSLRVILRWKQVANFGATVDGRRVMDDIPNIILHFAASALNTEKDNSPCNSYSIMTMTVTACVRCLINALINDEPRIRSFCKPDVDGLSKLSLILSTMSSRSRLAVDQAVYSDSDGSAVVKLHMYVIRLVYMMIAQW
jgi:hypothetical protein